jgi:O-antigen/teichoic acid export membrane protein
MNSPQGSLLLEMMAGARSLMAGRRAFIVSGIWSLVLRVAGLISGFALGVVLARMLGPTQFGIYGLVTTVAAVGMTIAQLGTPQLAVRELSVRAGRGDWAGAKAIIYEFGTSTTLAGVAIGAIALVAAGVAGASTTVLLLGFQGALLTLLMSYTGLFAAELRGFGALLKGQSMDITVRPGLTFVIISALLLAGMRMDALLALSIQNAVTLAAAAVSALWLWQAIPRQARAIPAAKSIPWVRAALPLGAVDVLRQFDGSYGVILVGWFSSGVELGVFRVAVACAVLAAMPVTIFHILLAPTLSRLHDSGDKDGMQQLLSWAGGAMIAIMVPIALGSWFFGRLLISLVFGVAYADGWLPLFLLTVAQLVYAVFGMGPILLAMCGGERDLIRIYLIGVGIAFLAAIPMTMRWGGAGAALGPVISALFIGLLSQRWARRKFGLEITGLNLLRR